MKHKNWIYLCLLGFVMLLLPYITATFVKDGGGWLAILLLFFVVNPSTSVMLGFAAGKSPRRSWWLPVANAVLFLAGVWLNFEMGEPAFLVYAAVYLILGCGAMTIRTLWG